jgi:hypothetical protein
MRFFFEHDVSVCVEMRHAAEAMAKIFDDIPCVKQYHRQFHLLPDVNRFMPDDVGFIGICRQLCANKNKGKQGDGDNPWRIAREQFYESGVSYNYHN